LDDDTIVINPEDYYIEQLFFISIRNKIIHAENKNLMNLQNSPQSLQNNLTNKTIFIFHKDRLFQYIK